MDRDQVVKLVAGNTSLSKDKVDAYADQAFEAISTVQKQLAGDADGGGGSVVDQVERLADVDVNALTKKAKQAVAAFVNAEDDGSGAGERSVQRRGDNVVIVSEDEARNALKRDLVKAMNNPSDTLAILQDRLRNFDANTVLDLLPVSRADLRDKRSDLEQTLNEAKAEVETRAEPNLQAKAQGAMRQAERKAVIQAEHARQTAASAAWWLVLSIVVSGVAAIGGALLS